MREEFTLRGGRRGDLLAADGVTLADFGGDERERRPVCQCPGNADERYEDGGCACRVHEESEPGCEGEEEVADHPGAAEGEAGDLERGEF